MKKVLLETILFTLLAILIAYCIRFLSPMPREVTPTEVDLVPTYQFDNHEGKG